MTHRDCLWDRPRDPSGRRMAASDAAPHRQGLPTPSDGPRGRPQRRLAKAMGRVAKRLPMSRIAAPHAPSAAYHNYVVRRTALEGCRRGARRAVMPGHHKRRATTVGGHRAPTSAARKGRFSRSLGASRRSPMGPHRLRATSCRGNGKSDPTCHGIMIGGTDRKPW